MKNIIINTNLINVVNGEIKPKIPITIHDNMINSIYEDHANDKNVHYNNIYDCRDYYGKDYNFLCFVRQKMLKNLYYPVLLQYVILVLIMMEQLL